jgi:hypothetical protein
MRKDASAAGTYSSPACYLHEFERARRRAGRRDIRIKRIYDAAEPSDGFGALVDRLWPRGISKRHAALDEWLVELDPSTTLRQWFPCGSAPRGSASRCCMPRVSHCAITHSCCGMCCASLNAG